MNEQEELRFLSTEIETKEEERTISGYAIVFNDKSKNLGNFQEIISPTALDNTDLSNTFLYRQHDENKVLASSKSGTLNLQITTRGLYFSATLPDTALGQDTYELIKRGDLSSMSFGFYVRKDSFDMTQSPSVRTVLDIAALKEISVVNFPAYESSTVSKRAEDMADACINMRNCVSKNETKNKYHTESVDILNKITSVKL